VFPEIGQVSNGRICVIEPLDVVTATLTVVEVEPFRFTELGETKQLDCVGTALQLKATD
jgi:hypothetical protein